MWFLYIDETSFKKSHNYVTVVYDEFHVVKLIVEITNNTARWAVESQAIKAHTGYPMRMNLLKLSEGSKKR